MGDLTAIKKNITDTISILSAKGEATIDEPDYNKIIDLISENAYRLYVETQTALILYQTLKTSTPIVIQENPSGTRRRVRKTDVAKVLNDSLNNLNSIDKDYKECVKSFGNYMKQVDDEVKKRKATTPADEDNKNKLMIDLDRTRKALNNMVEMDNVGKYASKIAGLAHALVYKYPEVYGNNNTMWSL